MDQPRRTGAAPPTSAAPPAPPASTTRAASAAPPAPASPAPPASTTSARTKPASSSGQIRRAALNAADRQLGRTARSFGDDFRAIRLRTGVSQAAVARAIGIDRAVICRLEAGDPGVSPTVRARAGAVLGATFKFALYDDGEPMIRDAAHARIVERLLAIRHRRWRVTVEAPIPGPGPGRRSSDLRLDHGPDIVLVEVETRIGRLEEIIREQQSKRAAVQEAIDRATDGAADRVTERATGTPSHRALDPRVHVLLVLPPSRHHTTLVRTHPETIRAAYPVPSAQLRGALAASSGNWPGDGLLWLAATRTSSGSD
ncbi:MAG: helix-turn-helix domain-containing protein [Chloroflexota bacterium]